MAVIKKRILLTGHDLTIKYIVQVARECVGVDICPQAFSKVEKARDLVMEWLVSERSVYGLNRGVGGNKDRVISLQQMNEFNRNIILSHCVATGNELIEEEVRVIMLTRLNSFLLGYTGIQPDVVLLLKNFLNYRIHPVIPSKGSVGESDLAYLAHVGLALIGEGEVVFQGERMATTEALQRTGLQAVTLGPKDGLSIISSNSLSAGKGAMVIQGITDLLEMADMIYALSLEGFQGNVSVLDQAVNKAKSFPGQIATAMMVKNHLHNSGLWTEKRPDIVQDPLSFRSACHVHGAVRDALQYVSKFVHLQLNSSDDNPSILLDEQRIVSSANFEVTTWVLGFEMLGIALSHLSKISCYRSIKLSTPHFTKLTKFLTPEEGVYIGFGTIQKTITALDAEIRHLSNPATNDFFSIAFDMEDHATNAPYVVHKTAKILDHLYTILGIEVLHAAQAIDLREDVQLGEGTSHIYQIVRSVVPFLDRDRNLSVDIKKIKELLQSKSLLTEYDRRKQLLCI